MAVVVASQVKTIFFQGAGQVVVWLQINNVDSADTIDVSTIGAVGFKKVRAAVFFGHAQGTGVVGSVVGTVITMTSASMTDDTVDLFVLGEA